MESPRKFNDCYFYYYSTCTKGDNCVFRHEPSALGCETMCSAWQQGKCLDKRCKLRHMELRKNRKQIPCYWENQPGGCRKKHCPFMHKNPEARTDGIAPSQPAPLLPAAVCGEAHEAGLGAPPAPPAPLPAPAPLPLLWPHQQQRQVVLDSAILGVVPAGELVSRRGHDAAVYSLPVDPLVVNFEEESDSESAPSSTPTKPAAGAQLELLMLERVQAAAAALYRIEPPPAPPAPPAGNQQHRRRASASLDFKVLSLDEIRARKRADAAPTTQPITLNLSRKRKQETVTTAGDKIIKVVRSNSVVYKKFDPDAPANPAEAKTDRKQDDSTNRKRTLSELSDGRGIYEYELIDNCHEFKKIKLRQQTSKPRLIRNRPVALVGDGEETSGADDSNKTDDSNKVDDSSDIEDSNDIQDSSKTDDLDVQIVSVEIAESNIELSDSEVIYVDSKNCKEPVDIVDLSDDDDVTITDSDFAKNVPDVVASCQKIVDNSDKDLMKDIDSILNDTESVDEDL